ncbi:MAG TPA: SWIM zinc finger family protein [Isosphaeraceae bacterium]|jgi:uncharacterized Zn finger protein|nr:SWIM zinc finger family protein [Isosphaeraceae bacterium]
MSWWRERERYGYGEFFPPSRPREAKGGIKARSKRGDFGETWWAKRWIAVLEGFDIGARLNRGRSYARKGQVLDVEIDKGIVRARVQGSRPKPYEVVIQARTLSPADWERLTEALAGQAIYAAKLLAGEMPREIEEVFEGAGLSLFPARLGDLTTKCSCPDWSNPCKHIAAVYYLLGEEFDRDPFLIFTLRGRNRDEFLARLGEVGGPITSADEVVEPPAAPEPLAADPRLFWGGIPPTSDPIGHVEAPPVPAALPKRLGGFPFWRGHEHFLDAIEPIYTLASQRGLDAVLPGGSATEDTEGTERTRGNPRTRRASEGSS